MTVMRVLFLGLWLAGHCYGQFTKGQAQFRSTSDDTLAVIKAQLIYLSTRDILSQELAAMGFDSKLFWQNYEQALQKTLQPFRAKLAKSHPENGNNFRRLWRRRQLRSQRSFGNLLRVLESYKVGPLMRFPKDPKVRYLHVEGRVSRSRLRSLYFRFVKNTATRSVGRIFWTFDLDLSAGGWSHLGVSDQGDMLRRLNQNFLQKLEEVLGGSVGNIILANATDQERIRARLRSPEPVVAGGDLSDAVWAHAQFYVGLASEVPELEIKGVEFRGDFTVTELKYHRVVYTSRVERWQSSLPSTEGSVLASKVAEQLFQKVAAEFVPMRSRLGKLSQGVKRAPIRVMGHAHYLELEEVRNLIARVGGRFQAKTYLESFSLGKARLVLEYMDQGESLENILALVKGQSLESNKTIMMSGEGRDVELKLVPPPGGV